MRLNSHLNRISNSNAQDLKFNGSAREEAERLAREEAERLAREEAERLAREEADTSRNKKYLEKVVAASEWISEFITRGTGNVQNELKADEILLMENSLIEKYNLSSDEVKKIHSAAYLERKHSGSLKRVDKIKNGLTKIWELSIRCETEDVKIYKELTQNLFSVLKDTCSADTKSLRPKNLMTENLMLKNLMPEKAFDYLSSGNLNESTLNMELLMGAINSFD